jgi:2-haloacid dehalogenase
MIDALLHREHTPYREIGQRALAYTLERAGIATRWTRCASWWRRSSVSGDAVLSVAAANSFKPHVATYTKAAEILGVRMDEVLFVANHAFDCIGAKSAGMHTAFIDRRQRPFGGTPHQPDIVAPDMKALAEMMVPG